MSQAQGALALILPTGLLILGCWLVGLGCRVALRRWTDLPPGWTVSAGLGAAVTGLLVVTTRLLQHTDPRIVLVAVVLSLGVVAVGVWGDRRRSHDGYPTVAQLATPTAFDLIAAALGAALLITLARFGPTVWTSGINDIFNYIGSAQVWLDPVGFEQRHPDAFGAVQVARAGFEKPVMTGVVLAAGQMTGTAPLGLLGLLTPITFLLLTVLLGCLLSAVSAMFGLSRWATTLAVAIPSVSIVPMSRVYDAQIGHLGAVAFIALLLAAVVAGPPRGGRVSGLVTGALWAVPAFAALGANFSLILGCAPILAALVGWSAARSAPGLRRSAPTLAVMGLTVIVLALPFANRFLTSFRLQSGGEPGFQAPPAPPWAMVGLITDVRTGPDQIVTAVSWTITVGVIVAALIWMSRVRSLATGWPLTLVLVSCLNAVIVAARVGVDDYAMHKWTAVFISVVVPYLLAFFLAAPRRLPVAVLWVGTAVLIMAALLTGLSSARVQGVPRELMDLQDDPVVEQFDPLNIDLETIAWNSAAALVVPAPRVIVVGPSGVPDGVPVGDHFLVRRSSLAPTDGEPVVVDDVLAITRRDLGIDVPATLRFDRTHAADQRFLFGAWCPPESDATWTCGAPRYIVLDVPEPQRRRGLDMELTSETSGTAPDWPTEILVNGFRVATVDPTKATTAWHVPAALAAAHQGRILVAVANPPLRAAKTLGGPFRVGVSRLSIDTPTTPGRTP